MGSLNVFFNLKTLPFRPALQERISKELLFDMPHIGADRPAIILGSTSATAFVVKAAVDAGDHSHFVVVGGKNVGNEDSQFTKLLYKGLAKAGLPPPSNGNLKEHEYARELLIKHFGVASDLVITGPEDHSTNTQQNMEVLAELGHAKAASIELYALAATVRRAIGTARKVWNDDTTPIAAHNVYPAGVTRDNWVADPACRFFAASEADKVLPARQGAPSRYERLGFCRPVDISAESARVCQYIARLC